MDPMKTGKIICEARKKLKMTQKDLADKLFVSDKAVSKWERGLCFPDITVLIPLTEELNISLYDLLRGEKMNKEEVEETLKNTINYSNSELKKKKKKYIIVSSIIVSIVIFISIFSISFIKRNEIGGIVDRDELYNISYYIDYKTSINNDSSEKLELILMKLPLKWKERTFSANNNLVEIDYDVSFSDVNKAYNDKVYVKRAMINLSTVLFTTVSDSNKIKIRFTDNSYIISRQELQKIYSISNFDEVIDKGIWTEKIEKKLTKNEFVNQSFETFKKEKVSKDELKKDLDKGNN